MKVAAFRVRATPANVEQGGLLEVSWPTFNRAKYPFERLALCRLPVTRRTLVKQCRLVRAATENDGREVVTIPEDVVPGKYKVLLLGLDGSRRGVPGVLTLSGAFTVDEREGGRGSGSGGDAGGGGSAGGSGGGTTPPAPPPPPPPPHGQPPPPPGAPPPQSLSPTGTPQPAPPPVPEPPREVTVSGTVTNVTIGFPESTIVIENARPPAGGGASPVIQVPTTIYLRVTMPVTCGVVGTLERAIRASGLPDLFRSCAPSPGTTIRDVRDVSEQQLVTRVDQIQVGDTVRADGTLEGVILRPVTVTVIGRQTEGSTTEAFVTGTVDTVEDLGTQDLSFYPDRVVGFRYKVRLVQTSVVDRQQRPLPGSGDPVVLFINVDVRVTDDTPGGASRPVSPETLRAGDRVSARGGYASWNRTLNVESTQTEDFRITGRAPRLPLDATFTDVQMPSSVAPNERFDVAFTVRNTGTETWVGGNVPNPVRLGLDAGGPRSGWHKADAPHDRVNLPHDVKPRETVTFTFTAQAPSAPGLYATGVRMVKEFVEFFGEPLLLPVSVRVVGGERDAVFTRVEVPSRVSPNERFTARITVRNVGTETWTRDGRNPVRLGLNGTWEKADSPHDRVNLPHDVKPGETVTFTFTARTHTASGSHATDLQMVKEFIGFFGDVRYSTVQVGTAESPTF